MECACTAKISLSTNINFNLMLDLTERPSRRFIHWRVCSDTTSCMCVVVDLDAIDFLSFFYPVWVQRVF